MNSSSNTTNETRNLPTGFAQRFHGLPGTMQLNLQSVTVPQFANTCRVCAAVVDRLTPIFEGEGLRLKLADKIHKHLPIEVEAVGALPRGVCAQCRATLLAWHELVQCCLQADGALRARLLVEQGRAGLEANLQTLEATLLDPNHPEIKEGTSRVFLKNVESVLTHYFGMMNGGIDVEFVCQLCAGKPSLASVDTLAGHLRHQHGIRVSDAAAVDTFIRDHVTFEETLEATSDREDAKTEIEAAEPNALPAFSCPFCKSVFSSTARLICHLGRHLKINIEEGVVCCDASYTGRNAFVAHLQEAHVAKPAAGRGHTCRSCGFEAVDGERLQAHIAESHGKRRRSPSKESPRNQKYIPAVCPECNKTFSNKYNMFVHMKSHGEQRRFPCDKCHRSYRNGSNLRNHKRLVHEGVMEYACGVCGEPFPSRGARDVHARGHAGLAPFACARCGKAFRAKNSLDRHAEGHLDLREHECHVCAKKFRKISHLKYHVGTHERA